MLHSPLLSLLLQTVPPGCPLKGFEYNVDDIGRLRSWVSLTATLGKAAGNEEMEALRYFATSVGHKGNIMDGVVTQFAGGGIEKICWEGTNLCGTLPVGDLNMPKLRVLNLSRNSLKGEKEKELSTLGSGI